VLVVEDEYLIADGVGAALADFGFSVALAGSADQALSYLNSGRAVSLVFSDINMPGSTDGLGLARQIAKQDPGMPVILTSGNDSGSAHSAGFSFVRKPYEYAAVARMILAKLGLES
jgi:DNA-binding NtrC family response regulator